MSHANFRSKRVFGQPHKIFRETNLYLQLMCLETDKVRAWRAFALLKGNLWTGLWQKCTCSPALLRLDALLRKPVCPGLCERHISHSSVAGGCGVVWWRGAELCCHPISVPAELPAGSQAMTVPGAEFFAHHLLSPSLRAWLSPPSVCCPGCLLSWQPSPKADPIRSLQTKGELAEADITSQSQRARAAPGAAQQSAGPDLLALPSPTLKLVTAHPRLAANSETQATEEEGE